ncbi:MAG TPA: NADPH:quinone oxidoreductase family protein [Leptospiraceae bacterium]|nr:NADPH:quinone oxidoreductase family protein [Leptospiraceae bacterium]HMW05487.1 NADPH:quinone oxidoreductase family protein [Leptospiraceae bacterium]HMX35234.1 NADPH:quinone oxidoreductase family protein [Leptospiraceae bacterium]HMY30997.1 NADPH:quinone oxidoreductase family protein [Leptospiraceae bacterium]HMZ64389.1 NADPH:quinone oxidoreductase family protein [Leptospiraceae bacterium]
MKAYVAENWCEPEELVFKDVEDPTPKEGEVVLDIKASGMNFPDMLLIQGKYQMRPKRPFSPGIEVAGIVSAVGPGVTKWKIGDKAMGLSWLGGYAEKVAVAERNVYPMPDGMSFEEAAGFIVTYQSSYFAIVVRANLKPTETMLVHAGAGGIGSSAIQIGKAIGAKVYATAGSEEKLDVIRNLGADLALNYNDATWSKKIRKEYGGVDVVIDPVGGDAFDKSILCTNFEGRIVVVGFTSGRIPTLAVNMLLLNNISVMGVYWNLYQNDRPQEIEKCVKQLNEWYTQGKVKPLVYKTYPLIEAPKALREVGTRKTYGKTILIP